MSVQHYPELLFIKATRTWCFWAIGWHTYRTRGSEKPGSSFEVLCIAFGPLRLHFAKAGSNWRSPELPAPPLAANAPADAAASHTSAVEGGAGYRGGR